MKRQKVVSVATNGKGLVDVTREVDAVVRASGVEVGVCVVFIQHTSASLVVQENADSAVLRDLERWIDRLAPEDARATSTTPRAPTLCPRTSAPP